MMSDNTIQYFAGKFRVAIEAAVDAGRIPLRDRMSGFPRGCCDDASDLLAFFLKQQGICTIQINGEYRDDNPENSTNHVWLETQDHIIIDITGDQFKYDPVFLYYDVPVYVGGSDRFHELFQNQKAQSSYDFEPNIEYGQKRMMSLYQLICEYL